MAEFLQIMKNWQRMCHSFKSCSTCPLYDENGWAHVLCSEGGIRSSKPEIVEAVVTKWAEENQEPVYPTWGEWLVEIGVFPMVMSTNPTKALDTICNSVCQPIPADIAQKLGIEPKGVRR